MTVAATVTVSPLIAVAVTLVVYASAGYGAVSARRAIRSRREARAVNPPRHR
jgi:hypothetical protein